MNLKETLKYMENRAHLQEKISLEAMDNLLSSQDLKNIINIQQGPGNDIIINGKKYPGNIGQTALKRIATQIQSGSTNGLGKDQILNNIINTVSDIDGGSIINSIKQNMNSSQSVNSNQNQPVNQGQNQLIIKMNGQELAPESQEYKELQTVAQKVGIEKAQQMYQQQGYKVEFTPPTQLEDNRAQTQALPPPQESINELSTEVNKNTPALVSTEIPNFDKFNELSNLLNNDLNKISDSLDGLIKSLTPSLQNNPQAQQAIKQIEETKNNDKTLRSWKGWGAIGNLLKGALNTVAGVAGNFIGGIASGMGGAR